MKSEIMGRPCQIAILFKGKVWLTFKLGKFTAIDSKHFKGEKVDFDIPEGYNYEKSKS